MKVVEKPTHSAIETFEECIDMVRDNDLKTRLDGCKSLIINAESEFNSKITNGEIFTIIKEKIINKNVTAKELEKVYTYRMAKKGTQGRVIYDKIISKPTLGVCPLCNHRLVETLDHYLPKANFPRLSVTPINLVPSCFPCNKGKLTSIPLNSNEETLHPYFDDIENEEWIYAKVNQTTPASLTYYAHPPSHWTQLLRNRAIHHFESFTLNKLYSVQAAVLLRNLNERLKSIHEKAGALGIKKYLQEEAESRHKVDRNSWQAVFYRTLSDDEWFCNGGFVMT